jgi:hypothetical protein
MKLPRQLSTRLGPLLLLLQRSPVVQMLFPEARLLGGAGLGEAAKWTIATVAGLGAYDSVAGATGIEQTYPSPGEQIVPGTTGEALAFVFQVVGTPSIDNVSWSVSGLPAGLDHSDTATPSVHVISGTPTEDGETTVTVTAWEGPNQTGSSFSQEFLFEIVPAIIVSHPASVAIASGTSTTLSVTGNPAGQTLTYRWFSGTSGSGTAISGAAGAGPSYTTPVLNGSNTPANYWVRVTRNGVSQNSNTATVTLATAPSITSQPQPDTIASGASAQLTVGVSGTAPDIQWFRGAAGVTTDPVAGATTATFITPPLTTTTSFWARATNAAGSANSNAAVITVTADPFEEWRTAHFTPAQLADPQISGAAADPEGDGVTNQDEHVFGTHPLASDPPLLTLAPDASGALVLTFTARAATGPGYAGRTRHHALETRTDLATGSWTAVPGYADVPGVGQTVSHIIPPSSGRAFYTLRVWLSP